MREPTTSPLRPNRHPYWGEVAEVAADLIEVLKRESKARPWAHPAWMANMSGVAQAAMLVTQFKNQKEETPAEKKMRIGAKHLMEGLDAMKARYAALADAPADYVDHVTKNIERDLNVARAYATPAEMSPIWLIARAVFESFETANRQKRDEQGRIIGPQIPLHLKADGENDSIVVIMTCEALKHTHIKATRGSVYQELRKWLPPMPRKSRVKKSADLAIPPV